MENLLYLCCKNKAHKEQNTQDPLTKPPITLPIEGIIAVLFQNIAYTSTSNYRKWFYNTYKMKSYETIKRDRRYSLHEDIDYDACMTDRHINRKIQKNGSIDSLLEEMYLCKEQLNIYYIPFTQQLLPIFDKHIEYFDNNIVSVKIPYGKIKFFEKNNLFFITFLFEKNIELSPIKNIPFEIGKKKIYIDVLTESIVNGFFNIPQICDIIKKMMMSEKTIISSHYKNCIFTDLIVYEFCKRIRNSIIYFSIAPIIEHSNILYNKINKKLTYYLINNENPENISSNFIKIDGSPDYICSFCKDPPNYRKNLKNITLEILHYFI
jgi:hypothetical protein